MRTNRARFVAVAWLGIAMSATALGSPIRPTGTPSARLPDLGAGIVASEAPALGPAAERDVLSPVRDLRWDSRERGVDPGGLGRLDRADVQSPWNAIDLETLDPRAAALRPGSGWLAADADMDGFAGMPEPIGVVDYRIPEPASLALVLAGLIGLWTRHRLQKRFKVSEGVDP